MGTIYGKMLGILILFAGILLLLRFSLSSLTILQLGLLSLLSTSVILAVFGLIAFVQRKVIWTQNKKQSRALKTFYIKRHIVLNLLAFIVGVIFSFFALKLGDTTTSAKELLSIAAINWLKIIGTANIAGLVYLVIFDREKLCDFLK